VIHLKPDGDASAGNMSQSLSTHQGKSPEQSSLQHLFSNNVKQQASAYNQTFDANTNAPVSKLSAELVDKLLDYGNSKGKINLSKKELSTLIDTFKLVHTATQKNKDNQGTNPTNVIETFIKSFMAQGKSAHKSIHVVKNIHRILFSEGKVADPADKNDASAMDAVDAETAPIDLSDLASPDGPAPSNEGDTSLEEHIKREAIETYRELQAWDQEKERSRQQLRDQQSRSKSKSNRGNDHASTDEIAS